MNKLCASILAGLIALVPIPAWAQQGQVYRDSSGLVAPAQVEGLVRYQEQVRGGDVMLSYRDSGTGTVMTVYFTRSALPSASMWFDQARFALRHNPVFQIDSATAREQAFDAGGQQGNGRAVSYRASGGGMRATALAMVSTGGRILKVRISSQRLDQAELLGRAIRAAQALEWPASSAIAPLTSLEPCAGAVQPSGAGARATPASPELVREASAALLASLTEARAADLCRGERAGMLGVYGGAGAGYMLAIGDAGMVARVRPLGRDNLHVVEFFTHDSGHVAGIFDGMPTPEQALEASTAAFQSQALARVPLPDPAERPAPGTPLS